MGDSGVYTTRELVARGYDSSAVGRAVAAGDLVRLRRGWFAYRVHDAAVATAVSDGGVLTCVSALAFHGLWVAPGHDEIHLRRAPKQTGRRVACRSRRGRAGSPASAVDSVPTALGYAAVCLRGEEWIAACDSYLNRTGVTVAELEDRLGDCGERMRELLAAVDDRSQSGTESVVRVRLRALGFDVQVQQYVENVGWVDLRIGMLLIECDSRRHHADYQRDRRRDRKSTVAGWLVLRITYEDVMFRWDEVLADIRAITSARRHRPRTAAQVAMVARVAAASAGPRPDR